jgi:signal transduction histidine kinase
VPHEPTHFASAERSSREALARQIRLFHDDTAHETFGDAVPLICLILNRNREVIYANRKVLEVLELKDFEAIHGKRPGDLFQCVHALEGPGGCGTSLYCENCGAVHAILAAQAGQRAVRECRLNTEGSLSHDFRVVATPVERDGEAFTIFTLEDIQHEKRRQALERTFFHDLLNTAGGLTGLVDILDMVDGDAEREEILDLIRKNSQRLIEEIHSGRALSQAESGNLVLDLAENDLVELATEVVNFYRNQPQATRRVLKLETDRDWLVFPTDRALFVRILSNLMKNALEASEDEGVVTIGLEEGDGEVRVRVHNQTAMPSHVKQQMFERSFSTKGAGRGIGTYSVKLFTEKYLGGRVWFESNSGRGTTFHVSLPRKG